MTRIFNGSLDRLEPSKNATLGTNTVHIYTIIDNDLPSLSINDVTVTEGNSGTTNAIFTVSLSAASTQTVDQY